MSHEAPNSGHQGENPGDGKCYRNQTSALSAVKVKRGCKRPPLKAVMLSCKTNPVRVQGQIGQRTARSMLPGRPQ